MKKTRAFILAMVLLATLALATGGNRNIVGNNEKESFGDCVIFRTNQDKQSISAEHTGGGTPILPEPGTRVNNLNTFNYKILRLDYKQGYCCVDGVELDENPFGNNLTIFFKEGTKPLVHMLVTLWPTDTSKGYPMLELGWKGQWIE